MRSWIRQATHPLITALVVALAGAEARAAGSVVRIEGDATTGYRLLRDGTPFRIRGAAGIDHLDVLAACGGNAIRTWDAESAGRETDGESLLDRAERLGITVTIGLWLGHERHGFRYDDPVQVERQRQDVEVAVRRFKDHPALLAWGLGNEMEGPTSNGADERIWQEVNRLADLIKAIDPNHPVMTVVANVNDDKVAAILRHAPAVDILGINAYAGAGGVGEAARRMGWRKPYCVTEYGLPGPWETAQTDWKAPIEPTSRQKAAAYATTTADILADERQCLGSYAFLWGSKQEATASWFGMFLPSGEKTITVDAVTKAWTGSWPSDRAPVLEEIDVPLANRTLDPAATVEATARYRDPEGGRLQYRWEVRRESDDRREGGDRERVPELVEGCIVTTEADGHVVVRTPQRPGGYRLFVTVLDGAGSGCMDNWPFAVAAQAADA
ncbi:MAG: glycoside hydrolase family 2 TIM barrel-domain containing protein [Planctomycetota bacterium]